MANNQIVIEEKAQMPLFELEKFTVSLINSVKQKKEAVKLAKEELDRLLDEDKEYVRLANAAEEASKRKKTKIEELTEENPDIETAKEELSDAREDLKSTKASISQNLSDYKKKSGKDSIKINEVETQIKEILTV